MALRTIRNPGDPMPVVVSYEEAARRIGGDRPVSTRHVERLANAREIKRVGRGRARRILLSSIDDYLMREAGNG